MTTDEQNNNISGNPSDETQPQPTVGPLEEVAGAQSRRKFLRLAVISGATVATVGATTGVALAAHPHTGILTNLGLAGANTASGANCAMCFESTELNGSIASFNVSKNGNKWGTQPGSFFVWFTAHNVPNGNYVITISCDPGPGLTPFQYANSGNNAFLYQRAAGKAVDCPNYYDSKKKTGVLPGDEVRSANTVPGLFANPSPGPYTVTGGPVDLQVTAHLQWDPSVEPPSGTTTYYFTATISDPSNPSGWHCTGHTHVDAIKQS